MIKSLLLVLIAGLPLQHSAYAQLLMKAPPAAEKAERIEAADNTNAAADTQTQKHAQTAQDSDTHPQNQNTASDAPPQEHGTSDTAAADIFGEEGRKNRSGHAAQNAADSVQDSAFGGEDRKNRLPNAPTDLPGSSDAWQLNQLGISPAFDPALFAVNAAEFDNGIRYTPAAEDKRYYFHPGEGDFAHSSQPQGGGFYRRILGTTAEGSIVAQDFYQDIDAPQTSPFLLTPGMETDFSSASSNGRTLWYSPEGTVDMIADFYQGSPVGWNLILRDGKPVMRTRSQYDAEPPLIERLVFNADGLPVIYTRNRIHTFYHPNGQPMFYVNEEQSPAAVAAWDEQGNPVAPDTLRPAAKAISDYQDELFDYLNDSREY